jgi:hypothetical protein
MPREPEAFLAYIESVFGSYMTPAIRADLMANDLDAVLASMRDRPSLADVLPTISLPCLLYSGEFAWFEHCLGSGTRDRAGCPRECETLFVGRLNRLVGEFKGRRPVPTCQGCK